MVSVLPGATIWQLAAPGRNGYGNNIQFLIYDGCAVEVILDFDFERYRFGRCGGCGKRYGTFALLF